VTLNLKKIVNEERLLISSQLHEYNKLNGDIIMKLVKIWIALTCLFSCLYSVASFSQIPPPPPQRPAFKDIDKDGDGKITAAEAKAAGISDADFKKADKNGDGSLTVDEYLNTTTYNPKPAFKDIDKNGDGKITAAEAKAAGISDADFKKADKNGDGSLTIDEYLTP